MASKTQMITPPPYPFYMVQNLDLRCVLLPVPIGAGDKTRLESRIKKFTPHCTYRAADLVGLGTDPKRRTGQLCYVMLSQVFKIAQKNLGLRYILLQHLNVLGGQNTSRIQITED